MRSKKIMDTGLSAKLEGLPAETQALYFRILLESNDAGLVSLSSGHDPNHLFELMEKGLIVVTKDDIILHEYISSNYGRKLNQNYNPHRPVLEIIKNSGYEYNPESNEIEAPENSKITDLHSLTKLYNVQTSTNGYKKQETPSESIKISRSKILDTIGSIKFALYLSIGLMTNQSFHTCVTLYSISHIPNPYNIMSAIFTALTMDFLIIFFVLHGKTTQSLVFFIFCAIMSMYSFHIDTEYFSYNSFFSMVVSFGIPYSVHAVATIVNQKSLQL